MLAHVHSCALVGIEAAVIEVEVDHLALADIVDAVEAEAAKGVVDGLALGVEDAVFEGDVNASFHGGTFCRTVSWRRWLRA